MERCPFDVDIIAKMHADARHRTAAALFEAAKILAGRPFVIQDGIEQAVLPASLHPAMLHQVSPVSGQLSCSSAATWYARGRLQSKGRDAHKVGTGHSRIVGNVEVLVDDRDVPFWRRQTSHGQEAERLQGSVSAPATLFTLDDICQWIGRVDQIQIDSRGCLDGSRAPDGGDA